MIRVGLVGLGFIGWIHWLAYSKLGGVRVAAICESDKRRLAGDLRGIQGNFGPPGEQIDLTGISAYANLDDLLADPQVDLVDISLPTSLHADMAIRALEAGKHVFCEKPMALRLADAERMVAAAGKASRLLMIGHVLPFFPEYEWALKTIHGGDYGSVRGAAFRRVIADPKWIGNYWSPDHIGGPMLDLHVHDAHFIRLVFGMPEEVVTNGRLRNGLPEFWHSQFRFTDRDLVVEATSGTINQQGRAFTHAFEIHFERATLAFDFAVIGGEGKYLCEPMLLDDSGGVHRPQLPGGDPVDAFANELREVVHSVRDGKTSEILGAILAQDAMRICEKQSDSLQRRPAGNVLAFCRPCYNSIMALLIDGYNLLHATNIFGDAGPGTDLHRSRLALLKFLAGSINERERTETAIVFDASGAPAGLPRTTSYERMKVHFAHRHSNADEMIEELLEQHTAPRSLIVVSSDHRVQRAARRRGATYVDSAQWYSEMRASRRDAGLAEMSRSKPNMEVTPEELEYWLGEFDVPDADDSDANPFPPGYAEDLSEDEGD